MAKDPYRSVDDEALSTVRTLLTKARYGSVGTLDDDSAPHVTRIALAWITGTPVTLISDLSDHTRHLRARPDASLLIGEPGAKGDPLIHPRLTVAVQGGFVEKSLRDAWLAVHPKAQLYVDFADFHFVRFTPKFAFLNGGFGKAYRLTAADLATAMAE